MSDQERAAKYSDLFAHDHENVSDCAYCPICSTIAVVRKTKPEVLEHLAVAARELIIAAGILLEEAEQVVGRAEAAGRGEERGSEPKTKIRPIDLD